MDKTDVVGVIGATSPVGRVLIPLLVQQGWHVRAFSRNPPAEASSNPKWIRLGGSQEGVTPITHWISLIPMWTLPPLFPLIVRSSIRRVVALSSTSRFTKEMASDPRDRKTAAQLADGEKKFKEWATARGTEWVLLRPTLIYGRGQDKNITEMGRVIRRLGFFPVMGAASGQRQPVHLDDVAAACSSALIRESATGHCYNLSGGETLTYRKMVERVALAVGQTPRILTVPLPAFRIAIGVLRRLPAFRHWTPAMAERMNEDLTFDHQSAARDLDFTPRRFILSKDDVPC